MPTFVEPSGNASQRALNSEHPQHDPVSDILHSQQPERRWYESVLLWVLVAVIGFVIMACLATGLAIVGTSESHDRSNIAEFEQIFYKNASCPQTRSVPAKCAALLLREVEAFSALTPEQQKIVRNDLR